jgi:flavin-dependent dehydrogenase
VEARGQFDIGVVGGGPAGATAARWLAKRGHRVALFHHSPRMSSSDPIWETLSPGALELLRFGNPDLFARLEQYLAPCVATVVWSCSDSTSSTRRSATLIDRKKFDPLLRQSAIEAGAVLLSSAGVVSRGKDSWIVAPRKGGLIHCRFLVNAAGRHSALREGRVAHGARTIALTARIAGSTLDDGETRVEAATDAWLWAVRCNNGSASVTLFVDLETSHRWQREGRGPAFLKCLRKTSLGRSHTRLRSSIRAGDATIAAQPCVFAERLVHIGDAALALDPLASQGIHHALLSAQQAGIAIHTILIKGKAALAETFLTKRHEEALQQHLSACAVFYQRQDIFDTPFWKDRANALASPPTARRSQRPTTAPALLDASLSLCARARWETASVVIGDLIESRPALCHPGLSGPVAYLGNQALGDLLADLPPRFNAPWLLRRWTEKGVPAEAGSRALVFLVGHRVLLQQRAPSPFRVSRAPLALPCGFD